MHLELINWQSKCFKNKKIQFSRSHSVIISNMLMSLIISECCVKWAVELKMKAKIKTIQLERPR